jgi:hypothetical protein
MRRPGASGTLARMPIATTPLLAFMVSLLALWLLFERQTVCLRCSGRGRHRPDCPNKESGS